MSATFYDGHDALLCDLDGVVYAGAGAIDGAVETLNTLVQEGVPVAFVTNNASRDPESVAEHLCDLGVLARPEMVVGAAPAGVDLLREQLPEPGASVLVVGSAYLRRLVSEAGYRVVEAARDRPAGVIQGFDPAVSWRELAEASYAVNDGAVWVATNADLTIPRQEGTAPGNGALIAAVAQATGVTPPAAGKPEPLLFERAARQLGARRPLVVGDRLDTDIAGGNRAGFTTALVLTGVNTAQDAQDAGQDLRPDHVLGSLRDLLDDRP